VKGIMREIQGNTMGKAPSNASIVTAASPMTVSLFMSDARTADER
jgi:hypothetical protein